MRWKIERKLNRLYALKIRPLYCTCNKRLVDIYFLLWSIFAAHISASGKYWFYLRQRYRVAKVFLPCYSEKSWIQGKSMSEMLRFPLSMCSYHGKALLLLLKRRFVPRRINFNEESFPLPMLPMLPIWTFQRDKKVTKDDIHSFLLHATHHIVKRTWRIFLVENAFHVI